MAEKIKWGMFGCGNVTERKSGPAFSSVNGSELRAVMCRTPGAAEDYAKRHAVPSFYTNADDLLADDIVNAVYIATPPESHMDLCIRSARAGKHVYVEKPMARSYDECISMVDVCREEGVQLFAAYYRRALPRFIKIKDILDRETLGKVRLVNTVFTRRSGEKDLAPENWRTDPEKAGCGYFCDLASHHLDLMIWFFGMPVNVRGISSRQAGLYPAEDAVSYQMLMEKKIHITGTWNFVSDADRDETVIIGEKGELRFSTFADSPIQLETPENGVQKFAIPHPVHIQEPMIARIVNTLLGTPSPVVTGEEAALTNRLIDIILDRNR